jgi:hypothetical protein
VNLLNLRMAVCGGGSEGRGNDSGIGSGIQGYGFGEVSSRGQSERNRSAVFGRDQK